MVLFHRLLKYEQHYSPHVSQAKGFSPVWMRWWLCNVESSLKARSHSVHTCGLSSLWYNRCLWYDCWNVKVLPQVSQLYGVSPVWRRLCFLRKYLVVNSLEHTSHSHCLLSCVFRCCCRCCSWKVITFHSTEKWLLHKLDAMNIVISEPMHEYTDMQKTTVPHVGFEVNYEKYHLVACDTMQPGKNSQKFWRNVLPASSGMNIHLVCNEQQV